MTAYGFDLAVFDIDGTLIPLSTHTLAPETAAAIRELQGKGITVVLASGRQYLTIQPELKALGFDYYICSNGTYLTDAEGRVLARRGIDLETVEVLVADMIRLGNPIALRYPDGSRQANPSCSIFSYSRQFFRPEQLKRVMRQAERDAKKDYSGQLPIACLAHVEPEQKAALEASYPQLRFLLTANGQLCDINPVGVDKGSGLRDLCAMLGIPLRRTIAFGDDGNDAELVAAAGIGVAMGNAVPAVKQAADYLTAPCEALGVVQALRHFGLLGETI